MGSLPPVCAARVPEPCVPPAWRYPAPSAPLAGAPPVSGPPPGSFRNLAFRRHGATPRLPHPPPVHPPVPGPPPGSFRPHVRPPAGSARIVPLWLSCSPKPSFLLGPEARNKVYDLWFTGGARSEHRKGPIQSSELNEFELVAMQVHGVP